MPVASLRYQLRSEYTGFAGQRKLRLIKPVAGLLNIYYPVVDQDKQNA